MFLIGNPFREAICVILALLSLEGTKFSYLNKKYLKSISVR